MSRGTDKRCVQQVGRERLTCPRFENISLNLNLSPMQGYHIWPINGLYWYEMGQIWDLSISFLVQFDSPDYYKLDSNCVPIIDLRGVV